MNDSKFSGLTKNTEEVFESISKLKCIKSLFLCGGTGISLQLHHRLSEDLHFELIGTRKERPILDVSSILNEIYAMFPGSKRDVYSNDHFVVFLPNSVKLSFYRPNDSVPVLTKGFEFNNIVTPSLQELLGMKIYTTSVHCFFRDYYDIYCLLQAGCSLSEGVKYACDFSRHVLHTKSLLSPLLAPNFFIKDNNFDDYKPIYDIKPEEIASYIRKNIEQTPSTYLSHKIKL